MQRNAEKNGNALVIVLVAVALFAALSFAITSSSRDNSTTTVTSNTMRLAVQNMLRHGVNIENAIRTMRDLNNIAPTEISFESDASPHDYSNSNCTGETCKVFSLTGGGVTWQDPPAEATKGISPARESYLFAGSDPIYGHGTDGTTASNVDLYMLADVNQTACLAINEAFSISSIVNALPAANPLFQGSYSYNSEVVNNAAINGKTAFCIFNPDSGAYQFIYVLLAR